MLTLYASLNFLLELNLFAGRARQGSGRIFGWVCGWWSDCGGGAVHLGYFLRGRGRRWTGNAIGVFVFVEGKVDGIWLSMWTVCGREGDCRGCTYTSTR